MRSRPGPTLAERSAASGVGRPELGVVANRDDVVAAPSVVPPGAAPAGVAPPGAAIAPGSALIPRGSPARPSHCWVRLPDDGPPVPGLLTTWRRDEEGWSGLVAYAVAEGPDAVLVQAWVPASHLQQC